MRSDIGEKKEKKEESEEMGGRGKDGGKAR
jgi:hypothetical protein